MRHIDYSPLIAGATEVLVLQFLAVFLTYYVMRTHALTACSP